MEQKQKAHNVRETAAEFGVETAEIVAVIRDYFGVEKKPSGVLTSDELDVVLEKMSLFKTTGDIAAYFDSKPKAGEKKAKAKPKPTPILKSVKEKAAAAAKAVKEVIGKEGKDDKDKIRAKPKSDKVKSEKGKEAETPNKADTVKAKAKIPAVSSAQEKPKVSGETRQEAKKPVQPLEPRPEAVKQKEKAPKQKMTPKPVKAVVDVSQLKVNDPPKAKQKGEAVQHGEQIVKRVDTRGSYVNLDKYNEKYESIAQQQGQQSGSGGRNQNSGQNDFRSKQKFGGQKGGQRGGQRGGFRNKGGVHQKHHQTPRHKETEAERAQRLLLEQARNKQLEVLIPDVIVISELASRLKVTASAVIKKLIPLGYMVSQNEAVDFDTASLVAEEFGAKVEKEIIVTIEERLFEEVEDTEENMRSRSPVVVVMGHVDHGKTSLLDAIRDSDVVSGEAGGITQHIGAHTVHAGDKSITFLDTPGHEAFTSMRARGAKTTDIAILVVAADDGIMPQTIESINHAKAANIAIIVAINKIDKPEANPQKVKEELTHHGLLVEEWGGDIICCEVSAKKKIGLEHLLEMINLTAEMLELKANPDRNSVGTVIEAKLDKGRGPVATLLVQKGTLRTGDVLIAGTSVGRVRMMHDDKGKAIKAAGPSVPVEITGLAEVPGAGDQFAAVEDERLARELVEKRKHEEKEAKFSKFRKVTLESIFSHIAEGSIKELPIIVKADVRGSVEAVVQSLEKIEVEEVKLRVIHGAAGAISESDVMLANASGAIIVGFNVRPHPAAAESAKHENVEIRTYRIIYDAIEEITKAMKGMLAPKFKEVEMARIEVRNVFKITGSGIVAGCHVVDGKVTRACEIRVVRDGIVVAEDKINTLKRFKDDVKEVMQGYDCGISLEKFSDIKNGDIFEAYVMEQILVE